VTGITSVRALAVDNNAAIAHPSITVAAGSNLVANRSPAVDGDARRWIVAHESHSSLTGDVDVACTSVVATSNGLAVAAGPRTIAGGSDDQLDPSVAWLGGGSRLVVYADANGAAFDVRGRRSTPATASTAKAHSSSTRPATTSSRTRSATSSPTRAATAGAIVWISLAGAANGDVQLQRFDGADGTTLQVEGGCGAGFLEAFCARPGNANFTLEVRAAASTPLWLALGFQPATLGCGLCNIALDPSTAVISGGTTDAIGRLRVPMPLPPGSGLSGVSLIGQFATPGGGCFGVHLSAALAVTIE
jgi:hypothetical protein